MVHEIIGFALHPFKSSAKNTSSVFSNNSLKLCLRVPFIHPKVLKEISRLQDSEVK